MRLTMLGAFELRDDFGEKAVLPSKAEALMAFLALKEGRPVTREALSELLWPERGEKQARNSLKQALYVLRRDAFAGREVMLSDDETLSLRPDELQCDVHALRLLLRSGSAASYQSITSLYTAPLLHPFPSVTPGFDDFVANFRHSLEADVLTALARLADEAVNSGHPEQSVDIAEQMVAIDSLREDIHRRLIEGYTRLGRRTDAMRVYAEAKAAMRRELDVLPSAETEALIARIRDGWPAAMSGPTSGATVAPTMPIRQGAPRIAVLPLRQYLGTPIATHLSEGITADVTSQLSGLRELTVISHGSTSGFRDQTADPREIGQLLNAQYLVTCSIRSAGGRLRLTTDLIDVGANAMLPSLNDYVGAALSFDDQDRIVARVVNHLAPQVREAELRRIRGQRPHMLGIYDRVLLSREHISTLNRERFDEAKMLLDSAIDEDPTYGEAYALAADWHSALIGEGWSQNRAADISAVENLTRMALQHDAANVRALVSGGHRRSMSYRDQAGAMRMFERALSVAPSAANAWMSSALCVAFAGDADEAIFRANHALELSPCDRESYKFYHALCVAHYTASDYQKAAEWGLRALDEKVAWWGTSGFTAASLAALGRLREASEIITRGRARSPSRQITAVVDDLQYQDPERRRQYGALLVAAGYPT